MELVLDVYKTLYNKSFPVVRMDGSPKQLIKQTRIPFARKQGSDAKEDYEYARNEGRSNLYGNRTIKRETICQSITKQNKKALGRVY